MSETTHYNTVVLHGFGQNAQVIQEKCRRLLSSLTDRNILWPEAPHVLGEENKRGWFYFSEANRSHVPLEFYSSESSPLPPWFWLGIEESVAYIQSLQISTMDLLIGFSQGAQFAHYLIANQILKPKRVIFISGFVTPWCIDNDQAWANQTIPALHLMGQEDMVIPHIRSMELVSIYPHSVIHIHPKKHIVPEDSQSKLQVKRFVGSF